jgi:hypothetical protein
MGRSFRHDLPGSMSRCSLRGREPPVFAFARFSLDSFTNVITSVPL